MLCCAPYLKSEVMHTSCWIHYHCQASDFICPAWSGCGEYTQSPSPQDTLWMSEITDSTKLCIYYAFSVYNIPMIKFSL
jgi:hypothetical protein